MKETVSILSPPLTSVEADYYLTGCSAWKAAILFRYESDIKDIEQFHVTRMFLG